MKKLLNAFMFAVSCGISAPSLAEVRTETLSVSGMT